MKAKITEKPEWHYRRVNREYGPVTYGELRTMALNGRLHPKNDYIKHLGTEEWTVVQDVEGLISNEKAIEEVASWRKNNDTSWLPIQLVKRSSVIGFFILSLTGVGLIYWSFLHGHKSNFQEATLNLLKILGGIFILGAALSALEILYKGWKIIRPFGAPLTGGFSVLLMLIPGINLLATFLVLPGWALAYSKIRKSDKRLKDLPHTPLIFFIPACVAPLFVTLLYSASFNNLIKMAILYISIVLASWFVALFFVSRGINGMIKLYWKQREVPGG